MTTPFVITGCGRSGTTFMAKLFTRIGIRTSHEEFFTVHSLPFHASYFTEWLTHTHTAGESSGLAVPYLPYLPPEMAIVHLIRNPVAVIASLIGLRNLHPEMRVHSNIKFNFRHLPQLNPDDDVVVLCMKYWLYWNRLVAVSRPTYTVRVETLTGDDYDSLWRLLQTLDATDGRNPDECNDALDAIGKLQNSSIREPSAVWRNFPDGDLKDAVANDAVAYGYTMGELESHCPLDWLCPHCSTKLNV